MNGQFDYNRTPLAPPGTRVLVHEKPSARDSWSPHGVDGWYIGPALESYGCFKVWIWDTRNERVCDTLEWFPSTVTLPLASSINLIIAAANNLVHALNHLSAGSSLAPLADSEVEPCAILHRFSPIAAKNHQALQPRQQPPQQLNPTSKSRLPQQSSYSESTCINSEGAETRNNCPPSGSITSEGGIPTTVGQLSQHRYMDRRNPQK